jgi:GT2 family glycosyltransferase
MSPTISIITPVYDPPLAVLDACLASVRAQDYDDWEHILVDDASPTEAVGEVLARYAAIDARARVRRRNVNGGIVAASNDAIALATGEFLAFLDNDDLLAAGVLGAVAAALAEDPSIDYLYTDEDHLAETGSSFLSVYKPDWSPERFRSHMYVNHLSVLRRSLVIDVGGLRPEYEGSQDYDLVLRVTERARRICHLPVIGYHWRMAEGSAAANPEAKPYAFDAGRRAVQDHCDRVGIDASVEMLPSIGYHRLRRHLRGHPSVSVVIPTAGARGRVWGTDRTFVVDAVRSIVERSTYCVEEFVVVAHERTPLATLEKLAELARPRLRVVYYSPPFNFAAAIDLGAAHARGDCLLLLNDDTEIITPDFLETMLGLAEMDDVAMVGCKLLFADGTLQHAGHVYSGEPMHAFLGRGCDEPGPHGLLLVEREVSGVTAACALVKAPVFAAVGGFSTEYPINYNDVDFCLKLRRAGYRIVYTPHASLYHFESQSRRNVVTDGDRTALRRRWAYELDHDPYHNPNLLPGRDDWSIPYGATPA